MQTFENGGVNLRVFTKGGVNLKQYKPSIPFLGHRQTVLTQIRCRRMWRLIRVCTVCLKEFLFKIK